MWGEARQLSTDVINRFLYVQAVVLFNWFGIGELAGPRSDERYWFAHMQPMPLPRQKKWKNVLVSKIGLILVHNYIGGCDLIL
jgi:hypothetical protein